MLSNLNADLLKTILVFLAMSPDGATDFARVMMTCKTFMSMAEDSCILKALNWSNVKLDGPCEIFYNINGLLSRSAEVGNESAKYLLSKAVLLGSKPLWSRMLENDTLQASIYGFKGYSLDVKQDVARIVEEEALRELPCISNVFDGNRHHARLVRFFLSRCSPDDLSLMCGHLDVYLEYLAGFKEVLYSGIFSRINRMCAYDRDAYMERAGRYISEELMGESGSSQASLSLMVYENLFEGLRKRVISDFDRLFPPPHTYHLE